MNKKSIINKISKELKDTPYFVEELNGSDYDNSFDIYIENHLKEGCVYPTQLEVFYSRYGRYKYRDYRYLIEDKRNAKGETKNFSEKYTSYFGQCSSTVSFNELIDVIKNKGDYFFLGGVIHIDKKDFWEVDIQHNEEPKIITFGSEEYYVEVA